MLELGVFIINGIIKDRACSAVFIKTRTSYVGAVKPRLVHEKKGAISDILFLKHVYFQLKLVLCVNLFRLRHGWYFFVIVTKYAQSVHRQSCTCLLHVLYEEVLLEQSEIPQPLLRNHS